MGEIQRIIPKLIILPSTDPPASHAGAAPPSASWPPRSWPPAPPRRKRFLLADESDPERMRVWVECEQREQARRDRERGVRPDPPAELEYDGPKNQAQSEQP
jgi:hypothetical protein